MATAMQTAPMILIVNVRYLRSYIDDAAYLLPFQIFCCEHPFRTCSEIICNCTYSRPWSRYELKTGEKLRFDDDSSKVDRSALQIHPPKEQAALDLWHDRINANRVELLLNPGECVFFNNRRVMHSRSGFEDRQRLLFRLWLRSHQSPNFEATTEKETAKL